MTILGEPDARPDVWDWFTKAADFKTSKMAFCKQLGCEYAKDKHIPCRGGNTTGMWSHLKSKHKAIYDKLFPDKLKNQPKLPFASAAACSGPIQPKEDGTRESVRRAQRDFIIRGDHAFTIIEEDGFHWMLEKVKELPVSTPVPFYSAKTITSDTMMLFGGFRGRREALNLMTSKSSSHFLPALAEFQILRKEWEEIIAIVEFLRPFSNITIQCQGDKYVTISSVVAAFNGLMDECEEKIKHCF